MAFQRLPWFPTYGAKDLREYCSRCEAVSTNTCNNDVTLVGLYNHLVADGICLVYDDNALRVREVNRSEITDGFCVRVSESQRTRDNTAMCRLDNDNTMITNHVRVAAVMRYNTIAITRQNWPNYKRDCPSYLSGKISWLIRPKYVCVCKLVLFCVWKINNIISWNKLIKKPDTILWFLLILLLHQIWLNFGFIH